MQPELYTALSILPFSSRIIVSSSPRLLACYPSRTLPVQLQRRLGCEHVSVCRFIRRPRQRPEHDARVVQHLAQLRQCWQLPVGVLHGALLTLSTLCMS